MEFFRLAGKIAGGIVRLTGHKGVAVVGETRLFQFDQLQSILMKLVAGYATDVFER